jgi:glutaconate CoA-transferase subunit B
MKRYAKDYTIEELMATVISREMRSARNGFIGTGTGGRTYTLAVGIPLAGMSLARMTSNPNLSILFSYKVNPVIEEMPSPDSLTSPHELMNWRCEANLAYDAIFMMAMRGEIDTGFGSAAQIDKFGNANIVVIGDYRKPKVRLIGPIFQTEHFALFGREILLMDHERRNFVEKVDFISGVGYLEGGDSRRRAGLKRGGPDKIVTNLAVLGFDEKTGRVKVLSLHHGVEASEVQKNTGFELVIPRDVPETEPPTVDEVGLLRTKVDPRRIMLGTYY